MNNKLTWKKWNSRLWALSAWYMFSLEFKKIRGYLGFNKLLEKMFPWTYILPLEFKLRRKLSKRGTAATDSKI